MARLFSELRNRMSPKARARAEQLMKKDLLEINHRAWKECFDRLESVRSFQADWDGAGAEPIPVPIINSALDFLSQLHERYSDDPPTNVVASPSGSIIIEWHTHDSYRGAEIEKPYEVEWMIRNALGTIHRTRRFPAREPGPKA